jgi:site-specific DNA recombinase
VETAKQSGQVQFTEMMRFLRRSRSCRVLLVEKTDRLYRNIKDWVSIDDLDVEVHLVKENLVLSRDSRSSEKFMHGIKVLMAKNYIDNLTEEVTKGMCEKAEEGIWPSFAPLGYRNVLGADGKKTIEPDPERAPLVVKLFEWYSTGDHSVKHLRQLARQAGLTFRKTGAPIPTSTAHRILRNRVYSGEFQWHGKIYKGSHQALVSTALWQRVQDVLDGRHLQRPKRRRHTFTFAGLVRCGHCGCSMVGGIQKGKYVYYHCTGYKGKCPEPYTREERIEEQFCQLTSGLRFEPEVLDWVTKALRQSHKDEKRFHDQAIARLQSEQTQLQNRIGAMYIDKLDGRISVAFFDRKAAEWRAEQERVAGAIQDHQQANRSYLDAGIKLLELANRAHELFRKQEPAEKRELLKFVVSNSTWKDGKLAISFRQPFDLISEQATKTRMNDSGPDNNRTIRPDFENWSGARDLNPGPHGPEPCALPDCASPRLSLRSPF